MDTNVFFAFIFILLLVFCLSEIEDAFGLFVLGFMAAVVAINLDTVMDIEADAYQGAYTVIQLFFVFISIFAFVKTYYLRKSMSYE